MMKQLILFGTSGCHLCEQAELILASCDKYDLNIELIDIAEHVQWQENYAIRIPVIYDPETNKELGWPFTQIQLQTFIDEMI